MLDGASGSLAHQAGSFVQGSGPAPGDRTALLAFERALARLSEAATGLMTVCRSCQGTSTTGPRLPA